MLTIWQQCLRNEKNLTLENKLNYSFFKIIEDAYEYDNASSFGFADKELLNILEKLSKKIIIEVTTKEGEVNTIQTLTDFSKLLESMGFYTSSKRLNKI